MTLREWIEAGLVVLILGSGWLTMRAWSARDAAIARAEASDSVAAERTQEAIEARRVAERATERAARDSARAERALLAQARASARADSISEVLDAQVSQASDDAAAFGEGLFTTLDSIEVVLAPPHRPLVATARIQARGMQEGRRQIERAFQEQQIEFARFRHRTETTVDTLVAAINSERAAKNRWMETAGNEREARLAEQAAKEEWRDIAQPGFFGRIAQNVPLVVGSVGFGALACLFACP